MSTQAPLDGGGLATGAASLHQRPPSANYFSYPSQDMAIQDQTLSNTLANAHIASPVPVDSRQPKFNEEWDASVRGGSIVDGPSAAQHPYQQQQQQRQRSQSPNVQHANSTYSRSEIATSDNASAHGISLSRGNTLKKKNSLRRSGSLKRSSSRRSMKAGSVRSLALQSSHQSDEIHSAFYCPVPTSGAPTEVLAQRFQSWRKILKDLIAYFREIQSHYEHRSKSLVKLANVCNNISTPPGFLASEGLGEALQILGNYHKAAIVEANKAKEIEGDVILSLTGLRNDLNQKMKEIKSLSGDFKNSVEKEIDGTRKAVKALQDVLGHNELDPSMTTGKQDPYLLRLAVDRQVERQLDEENYLHQAYLNLEASGRELESIVVGEIQKSYNAYAGILKREADAGYGAVDELRTGPIAMPKDREWINFIQKDSQYVLSPTHLHEFKTADKTGPPVMSLYLPEQKLGSHSTEGGSSNKFIVKGRQTGTMHRGHTWVFRAESHDTMMAWYEDIKALTEKSPEELSNFVRGHARTYSRSSQRSISSDGMVDEEDDVPFSADPAVSIPSSRQDSFQNKSHTGGRFPSDIQVNAQRGLLVPQSPTSSGVGFVEHGTNMGQTSMNGANSDYSAIAAAGALPGSGIGDHYPSNYPSQQVGQSYGNTSSIKIDQAPSHAVMIDHAAREDGVNPYSGEPLEAQQFNSGRASNAPIVVAGPIPASMLEPSRNSVASLSEDSGLSSPFDAPQPPAFAGMANGSLKQAPRMMNGQTRPGGQRNNSTPHVPGEYPRSTPGGTPLA
ncbi:hypothetical protein FHL15_011204 [Xylaria flabelliformis]|uniref:SLM1/RGC1-like BAR-like domain-containing protein n=1 Tax=Xylaria flabelliformis TaxID=2512241 RepID=A0A553HIY7_9PEZI|nr:hypothetical protein FHL15_011204 [Xylaria flabelliformis]